MGVSLGGGDAEAERGRIDPPEEFAQGSVSNTSPRETCSVFRWSILRNNLNQFTGGRNTNLVTLLCSKLSEEKDPPVK